MDKGTPVVPAVIGTIMGIVVLIGILSYLSGKGFPFARDDRAAVIALAIVGLVMCVFGIQTAGGSLGWLNPGMFVGAALGIVMLTAFVSALANRPVPVIGSYRSAFIAMAVIMGIKWLVSTASLVVRIAR